MGPMSRYYDHYGLAINYSELLAVVDSYASLRAFIVAELSDGFTVNVSGRVSPEDGGGGLFRYVAASVVAENSATVIEPDEGVGRWERIYSTPVDVRWFGAVGDGSTSNDTAFADAIAFLESEGGGDLFVPVGVFRFDASVNLGSKGKRLYGAGWTSRVSDLRGGAQWVPSAIEGTVLWFPASAGLVMAGDEQRVERMALLGPGNAANGGGISVSPAKARNGVRDVMVANFEYGIKTNASESSAFEVISAIGCTTGIYASGTDQAWRDIFCVANVDAIEASVFGGYFSHCTIQGNVGYGFVATGSIESICISDSWWELNTSGSIHLDATAGFIKSFNVRNSRSSDTVGVVYSGAQQITSVHFGPNTLFQSCSMTVPSTVLRSSISSDSSFYSITNNSPDFAIPFAEDGTYVYASTNVAWELAFSGAPQVSTLAEYFFDVLAYDTATSAHRASWRDLRATYYMDAGGTMNAVGAEIGMVAPTVSSDATAADLRLWIVRAGSQTSVVMQVGGVAAAYRWQINVRRRDLRP